MQGSEAKGESAMEKRSSLQKWLHAGWTRQYEMPFPWFMKHHHPVRNVSSHPSSPTVLQRGGKLLLRSFTAALEKKEESEFFSAFSRGRYVVVKLDKLNREERRKARSTLSVHGMKDTHVIDDIHMLVYIDSPHATHFYSSLEAGSSTAEIVSFMTVLDVYSTPSGARLKLSSPLRFAMSCNKSFGKNSWSSNESEGAKKLNLNDVRLILDVRTSEGKEKVVESALRGMRREVSASECRWSLLSVLNGKGLVRWELRFSGKKKRDDESLICRCAFLIYAVAENPSVRWMEAAVQYAEVVNDHASAVVQQGKQEEKAAEWPFWNSGIDGTGEVIGIADSGIDYDSCFFDDPLQPVAIYPKVNHLHRKVVSFAPCDLIPGDYYVGDKLDGHGTHVAGTAAGNIIIDGNKSKFSGVAKGAKIFFKGLGCRSQTDLTLPVDFVDVFRPGYNEGTRVFSNSWGFFAPPEYTAVEKNIDNYVSEKGDAVIIFASGNVPGSGLMTPCRAKNMICIGAHMNTFDQVKINSVASFSSYGPTYDKRVKPELVGPGQWVNSAYSDNNITSKQCIISTKKGTSMATAAVAGSAALIRHHLRVWENVTYPSAALMKALLIHSAVYLNNSRVSGFGRVDLSVFFTPSGVKGWFRDKETITHHETKVYCFTADSKATVMNDMVRISLVWTDIGTALEGSRRSLVNDLDLLVIDSTGSIHYAGENGPDKTNIMEQIRLTPSEVLSKGFRVVVYGEDIHDGAVQPYALVVSAPNLWYVNDCIGMPNKCPNACSGKGQCINGICNCFSEYRFIDCSLCNETYLCHDRGTCSSKDLQCTCDSENFADEFCSKCKENWYGPACSSDCICSGRGECDKEKGECKCSKDERWGGTGCYTGPNCEFCCYDFYGEKCNKRSYWCREDGWPVIVNDTAGGYIQLNGFGIYPPMTTCRWSIEGPKRRKVRLEYLEFNIEDATDVLLVYNVETNGAIPLRIDTGTSPEGVVLVSTYNVLSLVFNSRWSRNRVGFLLHYSFVKPETPNCTLLCVNYAICEHVGDAFCVCEPEWYGWSCEKKVLKDKTPVQMQIVNNSWSKRIIFETNKAILFFITGLSSVETDHVSAKIYVNFTDSLFTMPHFGIALQASILLNTPVDGITPWVNEKVLLTNTCRSVWVDVSLAIRNAVNDTLNISLTLLHNASLGSTINGNSNHTAQVYFEINYLQDSKDTATYKKGRLLSVNCVGESHNEISNVTKSFSNDTNKSSEIDHEMNNHHIHVNMALVFLAFFLGILATCYFFCCRSINNYELGEIPSSEVIVSTMVSENLNNVANCGRSGHHDIPSSQTHISLSPEGSDVHYTAAQRRQGMSGEYTMLGRNDEEMKDMTREY